VDPPHDANTPTRTRTTRTTSVVRILRRRSRADLLGFMGRCLREGSCANLARPSVTPTALERCAETRAAWELRGRCEALSLAGRTDSTFCDLPSYVDTAGGYHLLPAIACYRLLPVAGYYLLPAPCPSSSSAGRMLRSRSTSQGYRPRSPGPASPRAQSTEPSDSLTNPDHLMPGRSRKPLVGALF
jgi:hypothetical protein